VTPDSLQQAAEWFALLRCDTGGERNRIAWKHWLEQRPEHRDAWCRIETISQRFEPLRAAREPAADTIRALASRRGRRRRFVGQLALLAGAGGLGWASWRHTALPGLVASALADQRTGAGEIRQIAVDDSRLWLNGDSAVDVALDAGTRRLALRRGEMLVDAAPGPAPARVVDTPQGRITAVAAARFDVKLEEGAALVSVFSGRVAVRTVRGDDCAVQAGQQMRFTCDATGTLEPVRLAREAWTRGVLLADNMPLAELVAELSGHFHGHIGIAREVAGLRVLGGYPLQQPLRALAMVAQVLPIRVERTLDWWVRIEPDGTRA